MNFILRREINCRKFSGKNFIKIFISATVEIFFRHNKKLTKKIEFAIIGVESSEVKNFGV